MNKKMALVVLLVIGILILFIIWNLYFTCCPSLTKDVAVSACIAACKSALNSGANLNNGPCLSNNITEDWVCDVAHYPREDIDNLAENQCSAYLERKANHFVEVDVDCNLIKAF